MKGSPPDQAEKPKDLADIDAEQIPSSDQARAIPYFAGEQLLAARYICDAFNEFTKPAPASRPGKK